MDETVRRRLVRHADDSENLFGFKNKVKTSRLLYNTGDVVVPKGSYFLRKLPLRTVVRFCVVFF
jgi:hypothetical protein